MQHDWIETKGRAPQRKVEFPLTDYIVALMRHPDLGNACPTKAAQHYGLREDITRYYLEQEKHRRQSPGIPHKPA